MKKQIMFLIVVLSTLLINAQKRLPTNVTLSDIDNTKIITRSFYNSGKPIIVEFWGSYCAPCIDLLDSFHAVYNNWQEETGVKIIVISTEPKYRRKKALKIIKEKGWNFEFYFDYKKTLFNKLTKLNVVPQTFIYNGNLQLIGSFKGVKPNIGYCLKDGEVKKIKINSKGKYGHLDCDLTEYEKVLFSAKKQN